MSWLIYCLSTLMLAAIKGSIWWIWRCFIFLGSRVSVWCMYNTHSLGKLLNTLAFDYQCHTYTFDASTGKRWWCSWSHHVPCFIWWRRSTLCGIHLNLHFYLFSWNYSFQIIYCLRFSLWKCSLKMTYNRWDMFSIHNAAPSSKACFEEKKGQRGKIHWWGWTFSCTFKSDCQAEINCCCNWTKGCRGMYDCNNCMYTSTLLLKLNSS